MIINMLLSITDHLSTVYKQFMIKNLFKKHKINVLNKKIKFDYL